jgi:starch phosphorylase
VIDLVASGALAGGDRELFRPIGDQLLGDDPFMLMADCASYVAAQEAVSARWLDTEGWTRDSMVNVARSGRFSSDRSIRGYCTRIWQLNPGRA